MPEIITDEMILQRWPQIKPQDLQDPDYRQQAEGLFLCPRHGLPHSYAKWLELRGGLKEVKRPEVVKDGQMEKAGLSIPVLTEQAINWLLLPVNPETGLRNPYAPPLEVIWFLEAMMDPIVKDPKPYTSEVIGPDGTSGGRMLSFRTAMTEVRKTIGRDFNSAAQARAFAWLLEWQITWLHEWTQEGRKGGWRKVVIKGTNFITDWDVDVKARRGRPNEEGNIDVIFCGRIAPRAVEIILNNLAHHRFRPIPKEVYQMSEGVQRLYRQGLPFVLQPSGWRLEYEMACRVLGYPEAPIDFQPGMIRKYLKEIGTTVGWKLKEVGKGRLRVWVLKTRKDRSEWWGRKHRRGKVKKLSE